MARLDKEALVAEYDRDAVERFFWFARERHAIYLRRRAGLPRPWTQDTILNTYSFTNVFRELDKTTRWYRENVRWRYDGMPEVLLATAVFRWFNTIRTGETLFTQPDLLSNRTPFETFLETGESSALIEPLRRQGPPWVTGAYMIRSPTGVDKLVGIAQCCSDFHRDGPLRAGNTAFGREGWRAVAEKMQAAPGHYTLEQAWEWLCEFYGQGKFLSYEVITDLRHTHLLRDAPDIMSWANPGPGALRGAALVLGRTGVDYKGRLKKSTYAEAHAAMKHLLELSRDANYWPQWDDSPTEDCYRVGPNCAAQFDAAPQGFPARGAWPSWEMREPEMWLCEFTKYERTRLGLGRPRGTYGR